MHDQISSISKIINFKKNLMLLVSCLFLLISHFNCAFTYIDDPKISTGYKSLFVAQLTTYPYADTYTITFSNPMPFATSYYDLIVAINTYNFLQSNTISWNFTKSNLTLSQFHLKYQAGINSIVYQLAIGYMIVDHSQPDIQIVYFNYSCSILNQGAGFRSQNISYTIKRFSKDSNIATASFIQSFNLTNHENDDSTLRKFYFRSNMTVTIQWYIYGLFKLHELQFYLVCFDNAFTIDNRQGNAYLRQYKIEPITDIVATNNGVITSSPQFMKFNRALIGLNAFSFTKVGNKKFQVLFYSTQTFNFAFTASIGYTYYVGLTFFGVFRYSCSIGEVFRYPSLTCVVSCPSGQYVDSTNTLPICKSCHYSCLSCYNYLQTSCNVCSHATRTPVLYQTVGANNYNRCPCSGATYDRYVAACLSCPSECSLCSDNSTCLACVGTLELVNSKCICPNRNEFYFGGSCVIRIIGCQTHIQNGASLSCAQCYVQRNFTITNALGCICQDIVHQTVKDLTSDGNFWCVYTCGDGFLSPDQQCDDNNLLDFDGCSQICTVQKNFTCSNVLYTLSVCLYNLSTEILYQTGQRKLYQNSAVLNFTFQPYIKYMSEITNMSAIVSTTMPMSKIEHQFICPNLYASLRCNLTLTVQYTGQLQNKQFEIHLKFSDHPKIRFDSRTLSFTPYGNIAMLSYQKEENLTSLKNMEIIVLVLTILSILLFLVSIYFEKMIGVELIMTVQYIYYIFSTIANNPVQLVPIQKNLKFSTGFNQIYNYTFYRYSPLPVQLNHQYYEKQFLMNMNIMLFGLLLVMFLLIFVKLIKTCVQYCKKGKDQSNVFDDEEKDTLTQQFGRFYDFYWNKIFFTYVFFVMYQVLFNSVVTTILQNPTQTFFSASLNFIAAFLSFFIIVIGILSVGYWYYQGSLKQGRIALDDNQIIPYQFPLCERQYILIYTILQPIKILVIAIFFAESYCLYIVIPIIFIYFIFLAVIRPYKKQDGVLSEEEQTTLQEEANTCISIHNFGICFNQFCLLGFTAMCLIWSVSVDNYDNTSTYPEAMMYCTITILFLLNIMAILRIFYKKIGVLAFCQQFKVGNPNSINGENAFARTRKIIRDSDLKGNQDIDFYEEDDDQNNNQKNEGSKKQKMKNLQDIKKNKNFLVNRKDKGNQDTDRHEEKDDQKSIQKNQGSKKKRMKMLQDIKKAKNFFINWKDDPKPKFNEDSSQNSNQQDEQNSENQNGQKISRIRKKNDKNSGLVEMKTLMRALNQTNYKIGKATDKKVAKLKKSFLDDLLKKKQLQNSKKKSGNIFNDLENQQKTENKQKGSQNINQVKQRLRKDFEQKSGKGQKTQLKPSKNIEDERKKKK